VAFTRRRRPAQGVANVHPFQEFEMIIDEQTVLFEGSRHNHVTITRIDRTVTMEDMEGRLIKEITYDDHFKAGGGYQGLIDKMKNEGWN
jgi:hypothetical protein